MSSLNPAVQWPSTSLSFAQLRTATQPWSLRQNHSENRKRTRGGDKLVEWYEQLAILELVILVWLGGRFG